MLFLRICEYVYFDFEPTLDWPIGLSPLNRSIGLLSLDQLIGLSPVDRRIGLSPVDRRRTDRQNYMGPTANIAGGLTEW